MTGVDEEIAEVMWRWLRTKRLVEPPEHWWTVRTRTEVVDECGNVIQAQFYAERKVCRGYKL